MKQLIRKIAIIPEHSCVEKKLRKECSAKELLEEFIKLLYSLGYSQLEVDKALGTRREIKNLKVEIGKLSSYIDELEYNISKKYNKKQKSKKKLD